MAAVVVGDAQSLQALCEVLFEFILPHFFIEHPGEVPHSDPFVIMQARSGKGLIDFRLCLIIVREMVHHFSQRRSAGTAERTQIQALLFRQGDVVGAQGPWRISCQRL